MFVWTLSSSSGTPTQVHWLSTFNSERIGRNPLLVCAYTLSSRPPQTRMEIVDFLWSLCDGMLVWHPLTTACSVA